MADRSGSDRKPPEPPGKHPPASPSERAASPTGASAAARINAARAYARDLAIARHAPPTRPGMPRANDHILCASCGEPFTSHSFDDDCPNTVVRVGAPRANDPILTEAWKNSEICAQCGVARGGHATLVHAFVPGNTITIGAIVRCTCRHDAGLHGPSGYTFLCPCLWKGESIFCEKTVSILWPDTSAQAVLCCTRPKDHHGPCSHNVDHARHRAEASIVRQPQEIRIKEPVDLKTPARRVRFVYKNHKGEIAERLVAPIAIWFGKTEHHPEEQWLLDAFDFDRNAKRTFAMSEISEWLAIPKVHYYTERTGSCPSVCYYCDLPESGHHPKRPMDPKERLKNAVLDWASDRLTDDHLFEAAIEYAKLVDPPDFLCGLPWDKDHGAMLVGRVPPGVGWLALLFGLDMSFPPRGPVFAMQGAEGRTSASAELRKIADEIDRREAEDAERGGGRCVGCGGLAHQHSPSGHPCRVRR